MRRERRKEEESWTRRRGEEVHISFPRPDYQPRPIARCSPVTPSPRHLVTLDHSVAPVSCRLVPAAPQPRRGGEKEVRSGALRRTGVCVKERQRGSKLPSSQPRTREQTDRPREGRV
ncbi:hypothetical protein BKA56DRAFT_336380 [Ilyonectria sp. MPI-CAGE-AT-0026]|nr:hypothetical protein BKA56DRAFT_336380 [Ilyonectria sp. MPI-CAGE-AT-0026]